MISMLQARVAAIRATVAAGHSEIVERRYFPALLGTGIFIGCALSFLFQPSVILVFLAAGFAAGYATRSIVSARRRERHLRDRMH